jgi:hypothetical protein
MHFKQWLPEQLLESQGKYERAEAMHRRVLEARQSHSVSDILKQDKKTSDVGSATRKSPKSCKNSEEDHCWDRRVL